MCFNDQWVTDITDLTTKIRSKARYMSNIDPDPNKRNYEQSQTPSQVLTEVAESIESLIAKHVIYNALFDQESIEKKLTRYCKTAIKREIARKNATIRRQA